MRRCLQSIDQQLPATRTLQALKLDCVDNNDRIATVKRDVLWTIAVRQTHQLAKSRLGILKAPTTCRRLHWRIGMCRSFSGHAD